MSLFRSVVLRILNKLSVYGGVEGYEYFIKGKNGRTPAIQIEGVHKKFGDYIALDNLSLEVSRGEIFGFLGLNGAGKTTTIKMLLAMLKPTSGKLYMLGEKVDAGNYKLWDKVGYLEEATFYPDLTVVENLDIARRMQGVLTKIP
ncbi:ATP-binding cassette domain-containing protein [Paenibacillus peoriae]|uniref:ATP-binding cassette domain-containing protein n=1 Tax=Paenibacillus peoriae TaxID=59893 RepID=UPI00339D2FCF